MKSIIGLFFKQKFNHTYEYTITIDKIPMGWIILSISIITNIIFKYIL